MLPLVPSQCTMEKSLVPSSLKLLIRQLKIGTPFNHPKHILTCFLTLFNIFIASRDQTWGYKTALNVGLPHKLYPSEEPRECQKWKENLWEEMCQRESVVTPVLNLWIDQHKHFLWVGIEWHLILIVKVWKLVLVITGGRSQILCFIKHS